MRGLKSTIVIMNIFACFVAPFMGAWIEITNILNFYLLLYVAPFMGINVKIKMYVFDHLRMHVFNHSLVQNDPLIDRTFH